MLFETENKKKDRNKDKFDWNLIKLGDNLMIIGPHYSGKSLLTEYILTQISEKYDLDIILGFQSNTQGKFHYRSLPDSLVHICPSFDNDSYLIEKLTHFWEYYQNSINLNKKAVIFIDNCCDNINIHRSKLFQNIYSNPNIIVILTMEYPSRRSRFYPESFNYLFYLSQNSLINDLALCRHYDSVNLKTLNQIREFEYSFLVISQTQESKNSYCKEYYHKFDDNLENQNAINFLTINQIEKLSQKKLLQNKIWWNFSKK